MGSWDILNQGNFLRGSDSNTLDFYGNDSEWSGNIGFGDGRVSFESRPDPDGLRVSINNGTDTIPDNIFFNEQEGDGSATAQNVDEGTNSYLRPWYNVTITGGEEDLTALPWDVSRGIEIGGGD